MQRLYTSTLLLLCSATVLFSQTDYQVFRPGVNYHFENPVSHVTESPHESINISETPCQDTYTTLEYFIDDICHDVSHAFVGSQVCQNELQTEFQVNGDQILVIQHAAAVGDSWVALSTAEYTVFGKVDGIFSESILGGPSDDFKHISFYAEDANGAAVTLPVSDQEIVIGKNVGLAIALNFNKFPNQAEAYVLAGFDDPQLGFGIQDIDQEGIFDQRVGDELHIEFLTTQLFGLYSYYFERTKGIYTITATELDPTENIYTIFYTGEELTYQESEFGVFSDSSLQAVNGQWDHPLEDLDFLDRLPGTFIENQTNGILRTSALAYDPLCQRAAKYATHPFQRDFDDESCIWEVVDALDSGEYYENWGGPYYDHQSLNGPRQRLLRYTWRDGLGCGDPFDFSDIIINTIDPSLQGKLTLAPNPTRSELMIDLKDYPGTLTANIVGLDGRRFSSSVMLAQNSSIDLSYLTAGIYVVQLWENGQLVAAKRFVKQ